MNTYVLALEDFDAEVLTAALDHHLEWQRDAEVTDTDGYAASLVAHDVLANLKGTSVTVTLDDAARTEAVIALTHHAEVFCGDNGDDDFPEWLGAFRLLRDLGVDDAEVPDYNDCLECDHAIVDCTCRR